MKPIQGTYIASNGVRHSCQLEYSQHTNKYCWDIFGHNNHYSSVEEAIASLPSFIKTSSSSIDYSFFSELQRSREKSGL